MNFRKDMRVAETGISFLGCMHCELFLQILNGCLLIKHIKTKIQDLDFFIDLFCQGSV
jgi:hypothetical protein